MDSIFKREYKTFLKTLRTYINKKTSYKDLTHSHNRLIASTFPNLDYMRKHIHTFKLTSYKEAMEFEKKLKELRDEKEECLSAAQGLYQGCTRMDDGAKHLPPYPMMNMLEFGDSGDGEEVEDGNDYEFEF